MNFTIGANNVISKAIEKAEKERHQFVTPEHLLYGILESEDFFMKKLNSTPSIKKDLETYFHEKVPQIKKNDKIQTSQSVDFLKVIQACIEHLDSAQKNIIDSGDILASIYEVSEQSKYILQSNGNKKVDIFTTIAKFQRNETVEEATEQSPAGDFFGSPAPKKNLLKDFSVELVGEAKIGKIDPVIGRSAEIERTIQILCRKKKNNPIHVGEAGVGKCLAGDEKIKILVTDEMYQELQKFL